MKMRNTGERFGLVSILMHWLMAVVILGLFGLGWYMVDLTYYDPLYKTLPEIHQAVGILLALVFLFRVCWRWISPAPAAPDGSRQLEVIAAKIAHRSLYALIALVIVSGYLITTADGSSIDVFMLFAVPATISDLPGQEDIAGLFHEYLAYALMALVALHTSAALKHHYIDKNNSLRRMLGLNDPGG